MELSIILLHFSVSMVICGSGKNQPVKSKAKSIDEQNKRSQTHFLTNEQESMLNKLDPDSVMKISNILANIDPPQTAENNRKAETADLSNKPLPGLDQKAVLGSKRQPDLLSVMQDSAMIREAPYGPQADVNSFTTLPSGTEIGSLDTSSSARAEQPNSSNLAKLFAPSQSRSPVTNTTNEFELNGPTIANSARPPSGGDQSILPGDFPKPNAPSSRLGGKPVKGPPLKITEGAPQKTGGQSQFPGESVLPGVGIMEYKEAPDIAQSILKNITEPPTGGLRPADGKPLPIIERPAALRPWQSAIHAVEVKQTTSGLLKSGNNEVANVTIMPGNKRITQLAFSYDPENSLGPEMWKVLHPDWTCQGHKQSPIDIQTDEIITDRVSKNVMIKMDPPDRPIIGTLRNNGHAPTLSISPDISVKLFGAMLENEYFLKQLHFHFGCDNAKGSEHRIDGEIYPLELHLVFWDNKTFPSFAQAAKSDKGIVVLAVLFQRSFVPPGQVRNTPLSQFLQIAKKVEREGESIKVPEMFDLRLERLIPNVMNQEQADRFFTYEGSLTTPGCYESVTWIVYDTHPIVTDEQMDAFRRLKSTKVNQFGTMCNNFRPVQRSNGRRMYSNIV